MTIQGIHAVSFARWRLCSFCRFADVVGTLGGGGRVLFFVVRDKGRVFVDVGVGTLPSAWLCLTPWLNILATFAARERWDGCIGTGVPDDESYRPRAVPMPPPFERCRVVRVSCGDLHTVRLRALCCPLKGRCRRSPFRSTATSSRLDTEPRASWGSGISLLTRHQDWWM